MSATASVQQPPGHGAARKGPRGGRTPKSISQAGSHISASSSDGGGSNPLVHPIPGGGSWLHVLGMEAGSNASASQQQDHAPKAPPQPAPTRSKGREPTQQSSGRGVCSITRYASSKTPHVSSLPPRPPPPPPKAPPPSNSRNNKTKDAVQAATQALQQASIQDVPPQPNSTALPTNLTSQGGFGSPVVSSPLASSNALFTDASGCTYVAYTSNPATTDLSSSLGPLSYATFPSYPVIDPNQVYAYAGPASLATTPTAAKGEAIPALYPGEFVALSPPPSLTLALQRLGTPRQLRPHEIEFLQRHAYELQYTEVCWQQTMTNAIQEGRMWHTPQAQCRINLLIGTLRYWTEFASCGLAHISPAHFDDIAWYLRHIVQVTHAQLMPVLGYWA